MLVYECLMIMLMLCKSSYARLTPEVLHTLAGRPAPIAQVPTLAEGTIAAELAGATTTVSGRMRLWHNHTGNPRPPHGYC